MRTSTSNAILVLAIGTVVWAASAASASAGGVKVSVGGGRGRVSFGHGHHHKHHHHKHHHFNHWHHKHHHHVHAKRVYVKPVYVAPVEPCVYPYHSYCFVYPGDTWSLLSQREYGKPNFGSTIAAFNGLSSGTRLVAGQQIRLPVIHPDGSLTASTAPAAAPFAMPREPMVSSPLPAQSFAIAPQAQQSPIGPTANIRPVSEEPSRPAVAVGSEVALEGQALGSERGTVLLRINGLSLPVEVLNWTADTATVRMPSLDIEGTMRAELDVMRADGSRASRTAIELTPAATRLALGK